MKFALHCILSKISSLISIQVTYSSFPITKIYYDISSIEPDLNSKPE